MIYVVAQQHPTLPEVSMFTAESVAVAQAYQSAGWTVLEIDVPPDLRGRLAAQAAVVEKCMVAMNENADRGEKAEAEVGRLVRKLALEREEFKAELDRLKAQRVQPDPLSDRHAAELKALSMLLRNMEGPVTLSAKKIAIAEAIEAAVRTGGAG